MTLGEPLGELLREESVSWGLRGGWIDDFIPHRWLEVI